jgi:predicted SprT family Zn-dependent metalloprotease
MPKSVPTGDFSRLLRELAREYRDINWAFFNNRLQLIPLAISDDRSRLGFFAPDPRRIELSRELVSNHAWGTVVEVLKHEMAHQFVHELLGHRDETSHGPSFQRVCEQLGIDPRASGLPAETRERSPILDRVKKLLALANSPNQHEAETAMRMAHRLMLRHNLEPPTKPAPRTDFAI